MKRDDYVNQKTTGNEQLGYGWCQVKAKEERERREKIGSIYGWLKRMANTKSSGKPEYPLELFRHECARNAYHSMRRAHTQDMTRQDKTRSSIFPFKNNIMCGRHHYPYPIHTICSITLETPDSFNLKICVYIKFFKIIDIGILLNNFMWLIYIRH